MDRGALDHALERGGGHRFGAFDIGDQCRKIVINERIQGFAQIADVDIAGLQDARGFGLIHQGEQQVFQRGKFVLTRVGKGQGAVDRLFEGVGKRGHGIAPSICAGVSRESLPAVTGDCPECRAMVLNFGVPSAASSPFRPICLTIQFVTLFCGIKAGVLLRRRLFGGGSQPEPRVAWHRAGQPPWRRREYGLSSKGSVTSLNLVWCRLSASL